MNVKEMLQSASQSGASDIFLVAGLPLSYRIHGSIKRVNEDKLLPNDTLDLVNQIYELANNRSTERLLTTGDDDFSFALRGVSRFRVNAFKQRGSIAAVIRVITFTLPQPQDLGIPDSVIRFGNLNKGLVLVTGLPETENLQHWHVLWTRLILIRKNILLRWKTLWNFSTHIKKVL